MGMHWMFAQNLRAHCSEIGVLLRNSVKKIKIIVSKLCVNPNVFKPWLCDGGVPSGICFKSFLYLLPFIDFLYYSFLVSLCTKISLYSWLESKNRIVTGSCDLLFDWEQTELSWCVAECLFLPFVSCLLVMSGGDKAFSSEMLASHPQVNQVDALTTDFLLFWPLCSTCLALMSK